MVSGTQRSQHVLCGAQRVRHAEFLRDPTTCLFGRSKTTGFDFMLECFQLDVGQKTIPSFVADYTQTLESRLAIRLNPTANRPGLHSQQATDFLLRVSVVEPQQGGKTPRDPSIEFFPATFLDFFPFRTTQPKLFLDLRHFARLFLLTLVNPLDETAEE